MENLMQEIGSIKVGENEPMVNVGVPVSVFQKIIECSAKWGQSPSQWISEAINSVIISDMADSPEACLKIK